MIFAERGCSSKTLFYSPTSCSLFAWITCYSPRSYVLFAEIAYVRIAKEDEDNTKRLVLHPQSLAPSLSMPVSMHICVPILNPSRSPLPLAQHFRVPILRPPILSYPRRPHRTPTPTPLPFCFPSHGADPDSAPKPRRRCRRRPSRNSFHTRTLSCAVRIRRRRVRGDGLLGKGRAQAVAWPSATHRS